MTSTSRNKIHELIKKLGVIQAEVEAMPDREYLENGTIMTGLEVNSLEGAALSIKWAISMLREVVE